MRREKLADCLPGDWVALMDAEEIDPGEDTNVQEWDGWTFRLTEMPIDGGTEFVWVRE